MPDVGNSDVPQRVGITTAAPNEAEARVFRAPGATRRCPDFQYEAPCPDFEQTTSKMA